ncbi:MAG: hypothetical protein PHD82_17280, partial [Candidatus Riflebacteria bacterium]|nr:hypothetical protein [Candidatus Riflebacteria bacterium]
INLNHCHLLRVSGFVHEKMFEKSLSDFVRGGGKMKSAIAPLRFLNRGIKYFWCNTQPFCR